MSDKTGTDAHLVAQLSDMTAKPSIEDAWQAHCAYMAAFGFDRLFYGHTRFSTPTTYADRHDALVLSSLPQGYMERYFNEGHFLNSPMVRWAEQNDGACSWSEVYARLHPDEVSARTRKTLTTREAYGLRNGYSISFLNLCQGGFAAISLVGRDDLDQDDLDAIWDRHGREIELMNRVFHLTVSSLPSRRPNRLTPRQREVLEWVAHGKTVPEICALIDRKQATVEKHLRLAREAMRAQTTAQAVLRASVSKQIFARAASQP